MDYPARFWSKIEKTDGCWLWKGSLNPYGYGRFPIKGIYTLAHRLAYKLLKGAIPKGLFCLHKCDVRKCVNPDHIFLGTAQDNTKDMLEKRRQANGTKVNTNKLTEDQVRVIIKDERPNRQIAKDYDVSDVCIGLIKRRINWKNLSV